MVFHLISNRDAKGLLSRSEILKLERKGFIRTTESYPDRFKFDEKTDDRYYNYGYYVNVNEFEIIEWLIKNNISFIASCHYDQYTVGYTKNSKFVTVLVNAGQLYQMLPNREFREELKEKKCMYEIPIKKFLKEGYLV